jgi:hypothetical protein
MEMASLLPIHGKRLSANLCNTVAHEPERADFDLAHIKHTRPGYSRSPSSIQAVIVEPEQCRYKSLAASSKTVDTQ